MAKRQAANALQMGLGAFHLCHPAVICGICVLCTSGSRLSRNRINGTDRTDGPDGTGTAESRSQSILSILCIPVLKSGCAVLEREEAELVAVFGDGAAGDLDAGFVELAGDLAVGEALCHQHPNHLLSREG